MIPIHMQIDILLNYRPSILDGRLFQCDCQSGARESANISMCVLCSLSLSGTRTHAHTRLLQEWCSNCGPPGVASVSRHSCCAACGDFLLCCGCTVHTALSPPLGTDRSVTDKRYCSFSFLSNCCGRVSFFC